MKVTLSRFVLMLVLYTGTSPQLNAQNRTKENNAIGWYAFNSTFKVAEKIGIHTEYQWRRDNYITNWQQGLLRLGINYNVRPDIQLRVGYAWAETYPYGDTPLNSMGRDFTEHRIFEMITLQDKKGSVNLSHRFMLEQRWVGRYSNAGLKNEDEFPFLNRARYMIRVQLPLKGNTIGDKTPYMAAYNEVFIGFGKNVGENIFDQNRFGALLGYKFNSAIQVEGGYLNQIVQLGREVGNKNVFQYNNGFIASLLLNFDLTKKED